LIGFDKAIFFLTCQASIRQLNQIILAQSASEANPTSEIPKRQYKKKSMSRDEKVFFGFMAGITIALLIWWFTRR
jgi:cell division protein FtsL